MEPIQPLIDRFVTENKNLIFGNSIKIDKISQIDDDSDVKVTR